MTFIPIPGCDYSTPSVTGSQLAHYGIKFACRYASTSGNAKNLTAAEVLDLTLHEIDIVSVFETNATRAMGGSPAGQADYASAIAQHRALGMPDSRPMYFAVDFDAAASDMPEIFSYFEGINAVAAPYTIGVYGGFAVCRELDVRKLVDYIWQTSAWSGGAWLPQAHIRQVAQQMHIGGNQVDLDWAQTDDYGQWHYRKVDSGMNVDIPAGDNAHICFGVAGLTKLRLHQGWGETVDVWQLVAIGDSTDPATANYLANLQGGPDNTTTPVVWHADHPGPIELPAGTTQVSLRYSSDHPFTASAASS